jgi:hypothetical protein
MDIKALLGKIATHIINPVIVLGFVVATIVFFYGVIGLIAKSDGSELPEKKRAVTYGLIGLFVMFSVYGILRIVLQTFDISLAPLPKG